MIRLGIDLGGTKIEAVALSAAGEYIFQRRVETPQGDYQQTIEVIAGLVEAAEQLLGETCRVGVGTPGSPSRQTGLMKNCNSTCLNGMSLQQDLASRLQRSVQIANDANCFALSEAIDGAGQGAAVVFGVIIGTGVGGGLVVNQQPVIGPNHIAGEWGHNLMPGLGDESVPARFTGRSCYCGRQDCVETYLSGPGLARSYQELGGNPLPAEAIVERASKGELLGRKVVALYQRQLAYGLAQVINTVDPDVIVFGGGLSNIKSLYEEIPRLWSAYVFSDEVNTQLKPARYGDASGVRGAAWL